VKDPDRLAAPPLVGLVRSRDHCIFAWRQTQGSEVRTVEIRADHCLQCIADVRRQGFTPVTTDGKEYPA
jgi:hypothetical protein